MLDKAVGNLGDMHKAVLVDADILQKHRSQSHFTLVPLRNHAGLQILHVQHVAAQDGGGGMSSLGSLAGFSSSLRMSVKGDFTGSQLFRHFLLVTDTAFQACGLFPQRRRLQCRFCLQGAEAAFAGRLFPEAPRRPMAATRAFPWRYWCCG